MIHNLKPYPAYRDSGVPWLGEVPEHWSVLPNRALFSEIKERDHPEEQMLSVTITQGVLRQKVLLDGSSKKDSSNLDRSAYKLLQPGDIAYNKMRAWQGAIGLSSFRGIMSPAYVVQRPRSGNLPRYFHYLFRTPTFAQEAERWSYGITSDMWSLRPEHFRLIYSCLPQAEEQLTIVRYLDYMDRRIQRYIRAKQKLIKLLEEQKQAIIHQAVTGQIDVRTGKPYPKYKPSGVEWLGDVPEHWEVMPLLRATISRCDGPFGSGLKSSHYTDYGVRVVRLQNIGHAEFKDSNAAYISPSYYSSLGDHTVEPGDLLIAGLGDENHPAGRACVAPESIVPAMVKADCFRFRLARYRLDPEYAALHLTATAVQSSFLLSTGATRQRVNLQATSSRRIFVPPMTEQRSIVEWVTKEFLSIHEAIQHIGCVTSILREYRTRLIADVVTGKLDVREAAASLPEEPEEELSEDQEQEDEENEDLEDQRQDEDDE